MFSCSFSAKLKFAIPRFPALIIVPFEIVPGQAIPILTISSPINGIITFLILSIKIPSKSLFSSSVKFSSLLLINS